MILNSFLFWLFNMKILEKGQFSEGHYPVFSKTQCVSVTITKLKCPTLLDIFFSIQRVHKKLLNSLPREVYEQKSLFLPIRLSLPSLTSPLAVKRQLFFPHRNSRSSCNCHCLQFPSTSYVIRDKSGSITPFFFFFSELYINLTQSPVKAAKKVSLIFTDFRSGVY